MTLWKQGPAHARPNGRGTGRTQRRLPAFLTDYLVFCGRASALDVIRQYYVAGALVGQFFQSFEQAPDVKKMGGVAR
jgi:hypothetical protein